MEGIDLVVLHQSMLGVAAYYARWKGRGSMEEVGYKGT